jgi:hypothetical protein
MLLEPELSDGSSSINDMDWSFDTVLDLLDDNNDDDNSTIGAALKLVVEYGTMIYGEAQVERRVYGEDMLIRDLPDATEPEFRFRKKDLQTVAHLLWPKAINLDMVTRTYDRICLRNRNYCHFETGLILFFDVSDSDFSGDGEPIQHVANKNFVDCRFFCTAHASNCCAILQ